MSKATPSVEEPKKPHFTLNHWTLGVALIGLFITLSPALTSFGIALMILGVGLFVATMTRWLWLKIPFFFITLAAMLYYCAHDPSFLEYRKRGYDATAQADAKNAYTAAQAYFTDYPTATISLSKLTSYGYVQTGNVDLIILSGKKPDLEITSVHSEGTKTYTVNSDGEISF